MRINLLVPSHSRGLRRDADVLSGALQNQHGWQIATRRYPARTVVGRLGAHASVALTAIRKADVNIHIEEIASRWLRVAHCNVWIPNQEWVRTHTAAAMQYVDLVMCKTDHAGEIFAQQGFRSTFIGFSSSDRLDRSIPRLRRALHVAGTSPNKGTRVVVEAWRRHPEWPVLDIVWDAPQDFQLALPSNIVLHRGAVSDEHLALLQNRAAFHICPSAVEGFGHTLAEALSCAACVVTTDAPPMNELVGPERGILVPYEHQERIGMATAYHVSPEGLEAGVAQALQLSPDALHEKGRKARAWFIENENAFRRRLIQRLTDLAP